MDFQRIQIDGFGTLTELAIDDLTAGLNVYYGDNGSGKTTIRAPRAWALATSCEIRFRLLAGFNSSGANWTLATATFKDRCIVVPSLSESGGCCLRPR